MINPIKLNNVRTYLVRYEDGDIKEMQGVGATNIHYISTSMWPFKAIIDITELPKPEFYSHAN